MTHLIKPGTITLHDLMDKCGVVGDPRFLYLAGSEEPPYTPGEIIYPEVGEKYSLEYDDGTQTLTAEIVIID